MLNHLISEACMSYNVKTNKDKWKLTITLFQKNVTQFYLKKYIFTLNDALERGGAKKMYKVCCIYS